MYIVKVMRQQKHCSCTKLRLLRLQKIFNISIVTVTEVEKMERIAREEGVLTDGEGREKGKRKMKERRGRWRKVKREIEGRGERWEGG